MHSGRLTIVPISFAEACEFVRVHHRHHKPPTGHKFSVAVVDEVGDVRGVACIGRPVARRLDDGWTLEVNRVATDGYKNACSALYGAAWRATRALGYRKLITYTLAEEGGGEPAGCRLEVCRRGDDQGRPGLERPVSTACGPSPSTTQDEMGANQ